MYCRRPESQSYPGLHHKKRGQQVEEDDPAPLCTGQSSPGVLSKEQRRPVREHPEEGHKNNPRNDNSPMKTG